MSENETEDLMADIYAELRGSDEVRSAWDARSEGLKALIGDGLVTARLDSMRELREVLDAIEFNTVQEARKSGATWAAIGTAMGMTRQSAQQRFGGR